MGVLGRIASGVGRFGRAAASGVGRLGRATSGAVMTVGSIAKGVADIGRQALSLAEVIPGVGANPLIQGLKSGLGSLEVAGNLARATGGAGQKLLSNKFIRT